MEHTLHEFLVLNIIFAVINTILLGLLVWQLWVVRSRVDRFEFVVVSFVERVGNGVRGVLHRAAGVVRETGRAVERTIMRR